jgi:hypothetical protein
MYRVLAAVAALSIVVAGCGSGDDADEDATATAAAVLTQVAENPVPTRQPEPTEGPGTAVDGAAVLGPMADKWAAAESLSARFFATAALGSRNLTFSGTLLYRAPDTSHSDADYFGRPIEMLAYGDKTYINVPDQGWKAVDLETLGVDLTQLSSVGEKRGFFDLQALVGKLENVEQLSDSDIEGVVYAHYRATADLGNISDQLPGIVSPQVLTELEPYVEGLQFDFWIAKDTGLPRRVTFVVDTPGASDEGSGGLEMTTDYDSFNAPVDIPAEPVGAPQLTDDDLRS